MSTEDFAQLDGIEIPDDLLEGVAGGKLTQKKKDDLLRMMASAKASRWTLSRFIEYLQEKFNRPAYTIETDYLNEAIAFACENW